MVRVILANPRNNNGHPTTLSERKADLNFVIRENHMKKVIFCLSLSIGLAGAVWAQGTISTSAAGSTAATVRSTSGASVSGQLQNSLDVKKAKIGDQVVLKTSEAFKQNGKVIAGKGSQILGRITDIQRTAKSNANSSVGVVFDRLKQGSSEVPISALITSVLAARSSATVEDDRASTSSTMQTSGRTTSNSGGVLGGVTDTVGGVVNTTTNTVGSVTDTVGRTVGSTTSAVSGTIRGLTITNSTGVSAQGGSTLTLNGGDLRLEKGTTLNLSVVAKSSVD
jgi:hypothetical protein